MGLSAIYPSGIRVWLKAGVNTPKRAQFHNLKSGRSVDNGMTKKSVCRSPPVITAGKIFVSSRTSRSVSSRYGEGERGRSFQKYRMKTNDAKMK